MMHQKNNFPYGETSDVHILALKFEHSDVTMYVILPKDSTGLTTFIQSLTGDKLQQLIATATDTMEVDVRIV
jgi:serine protease inhibitor